MRITKKLQAEIDKWKTNNGACDIIAKDENIHFYNGGLFQDMNEDWAELWIGDLDDMIRYLNRLRNFLKKQGFNTRQGMNDYLLDKWREKNERNRTTKKKA